MPGIVLPEYPPGHPKNEDYAYDKWRQEQLDAEADQREGGLTMTARPETNVPAVQPMAPAAAEMNPRGLLQLAVQQGADLDKLERLMALQERWEATEARKAFVVALAAFKSNPPALSKNKRVEFETGRGKTAYEHATLDHVSDAIGAGLTRHGLSHRWEVEQLEGQIRVSCLLQHVLGHSERVSMQAPADQSGSKNSIQALGSTVTYLQRYTLLAATGMAAKGQDNDGGGGGGEQLEEGALADHLAAIDASSDTDSLKAAFGAAWKAAEGAKDKAAMRLITEHKDARKRALGAVR
ncbi:MAG: ERF family protein [Burkholderiales bacterium]